MANRRLLFLIFTGSGGDKARREEKWKSAFCYVFGPFWPLPDFLCFSLLLAGGPAHSTIYECGSASCPRPPILRLIISPGCKRGPRESDYNTRKKCGFKAETSFVMILP